MIEPLIQQEIEATAANVLPFPAASAEPATGKPQLYTADELKEIFTPEAQTTRTVRDLVAKVRKAYHWLDELSFKRGNSFTQFVVDQIRIMKESGLTHEQWVAEIQAMNPNQFKPADPQPLPEIEVMGDEDESVNAIARIRQDRYAITTTGTNRLARATQTRQSQRSSLLETRERVR